MTTRLSEIAQRLADVKSALPVQLPVDITKCCWVVPGKCITASLAYGHLFSHAEEDLEYLLGMVKKS